MVKVSGQFLIKTALGWYLFDLKREGLNLTGVKKIKKIAEIGRENLKKIGIL